jgi:lysophospholipase
MTYGAGNMPTNRPDILAVLDDGCRRGVVIVNVTQCKRGHVEVSYETGQVHCFT